MASSLPGTRHRPSLKAKMKSFEMFDTTKKHWESDVFYVIFVGYLWCKLLGSYFDLIFWRLLLFLIVPPKVFGGKSWGATLIPVSTGRVKPGVEFRFESIRRLFFEEFFGPKQHGFSWRIPGLGTQMQPWQKDRKTRPTFFRGIAWYSFWQTSEWKMCSWCTVWPTSLGPNWIVESPSSWSFKSPCIYHVHFYSSPYDL